MLLSKKFLFEVIEAKLSMLDMRWKIELFKGRKSDEIIGPIVNIF